jgi:hypothetical protein
LSIRLGIVLIVNFDGSNPFRTSDHFNGAETVAPRARPRFAHGLFECGPGNGPFFNGVLQKGVGKIDPSAWESFTSTE